MAIIKLVEKRVQKPWGRYDLPEMFGQVDKGGEPLGEIWFEHPGGADVPLLVKYLFTSEKLSIQVHPDDAAARRSGHRSGKDEAWLVLSAEPDALIGIGLREPVTRQKLREAALDGSIEELLDWRPAQAGDVYYSPAGTVHALGPGLALIEIQQNVDLTYRLYDYGRARELHLEDAIGASNPVPYISPSRPHRLSGSREVLADGGAFVLERLTGPLAARLEASVGAALWLIPTKGEAAVDGEPLKPGHAWIADDPFLLSLGADVEILLAYADGIVRADLLR